MGNRNAAALLQVTSTIRCGHGQESPYLQNPVFKWRGILIVLLIICQTRKFRMIEHFSLFILCIFILIRYINKIMFYFDIMCVRIDFHFITTQIHSTSGLNKIFLHKGALMVYSHSWHRIFKGYQRPRLLLCYFIFSVRAFITPWFKMAVGILTITFTSHDGSKKKQRVAKYFPPRQIS